jgi:hypothetical protein
LLNATAEAADNDSEDSVSITESELEAWPVLLDENAPKSCSFCGIDRSDKWKPRLYNGKKIILCFSCHTYFMKYCIVDPEMEAQKKKNAATADKKRKKQDDDQSAKKKKKKQTSNDPSPVSVKTQKIVQLYFLLIETRHSMLHM